MTLRRLLRGAAPLTALAFMLVSCGGGEPMDDRGSAPSPTMARKADFPKPAGQTLDELRKGLGPGPVLAPSVSLLEAGKNRFGFGLFDRARKQIAEAPAALYFAPTEGGEVAGPFPARYESLEVDPAFQSESVASDPDAARSVYVADVPFKRPGSYDLLGVVRLDNRLVAADPAGTASRLKVVKLGPVPRVGDPAVKVSTPTRASVRGDINKIETRVPPDSMHETDLAEVLGKRPVILLFSTPAICQSRVCGPVVDIAEQVKADHEDEAEFIHMEIYNENEVERGFRPQVLRWGLPTEPWAFAIDRDGKIAARLEGAFSARELEAAVKAAVSG